MTPSLEELTLLRAWHPNRETAGDTVTYCLPCQVPAPCPTMRVLDALEASEQQVAELRERLGVAEPMLWGAACGTGKAALREETT